MGFITRDLAPTEGTVARQLGRRVAPLLIQKLRPTVTGQKPLGRAQRSNNTENDHGQQLDTAHANDVHLTPRLGVVVT